MPELPEVETTRRFIAPVMEGHHVDRVEVTRDRMLRRQPRAREFADRLEGRLLQTMGRRGKFLLGDVEGDLTLVIHLGMSGRLGIGPSDSPRIPHTHVTLGFGQLEVRMIDPRTFGFVACLTPEEWDESPMASLGPDALLDLPSTARLAALLGTRGTAIKALLLDQRLIAGIGNIYADEILHRARLHPRRLGSSLDREEISRLRSSIRPVLRAGIAHGGTSLADLAYLVPDGRAGGYLQHLRVYGREDEPCRGCGTPIVRVLVAQRSTHFCPTCQPTTSNHGPSGRA